MMNDELFIGVIVVIFGGLFAWAFRVLPQEKWQIIAALPRVKNEAGVWQGLNLTYYGFFQATSNTLAVMMLLILLGAIGIPALVSFSLAIVVFAICWPSARFIARAVEKKKYTFTIGGALFTGVIITPWVILLMNAMLDSAYGNRLPMIPALAAAAISYAYGEGVGRLGCISFGCCYGKNIARLSPRMHNIFKPLHFVFTGSTKKVSYEGRMERVQVVAIQAITAVVYTLIALIGTYLYLKSHFVVALLFTMAMTQGWRFLSEIVRADFRGAVTSISAYQAMALVVILYLIGIIAYFETTVCTVTIGIGLGTLWDPAILLLCQVLWLSVFLVTGRSLVTGSTLSFFIYQDRI